MRNLRIVVTDYCNLACGYCYNEGNTKDRQLHSIDLPKLKRTVRFLSTHFGDIIITGGEPLLHPQIEQILSVLAEENKLPRITTNGILLDRIFHTAIYEKLQRFNISIDRFSANSFRLRTETSPRDYAQIISNIKTLVGHGKEVTLNMICDEHTKSPELDEIFSTARSLGVKRLKFIPLIGSDEQLIIGNILQFLNEVHPGTCAARKTALDIDEYLLDDMLVMIVHQYCNMSNCDYCRKNTFYRLNFDGCIYRCLADKADRFDLFGRSEDTSLEEAFSAFEAL